MQDQNKTREQLIDELNQMRHKVAELETAQKSLTENASRYRRIIAKTSDAIFVIQDGWIKFANEKSPEIVGCSMEEISASNAIEAFVHPDDREMVAQHHTSRLREDESPYPYDFRIVRKDGNVRWVHVSSSLIMWEGKSAVLCLMADISDRKRTEERLKLSEKRYRRISSLTSDIAYSCCKSTDGYSIDWMTGATERILGYSVDDIVALKCWRHLVVAEDLPVFHSHVIGLSTDMSASCELRLRHKDGSVISVSSFAQCISEPESADTLRLYGGLVDVTQRKRMEKELRSAKEEWESTFDAVPDLIAVLDNNYNIMRVNLAMAKCLRLQADDCVGLKCYEAVHGTDAPPVFCPHSQLLGDGAEHSVEICEEHLGGDYLVTTVPLRDSRGDVFGSVHVARNITERKLAEAQLRKSEERYRTIADFTYDWEYWVNADGNLLYCSPSCERITGYSAAEFVDDPDLMNRIVHPDDRDEMFDHFYNVRKLNPHAVDAKDFRIMRRDGETRWIGHVCQPVHDQAGLAIGRRGGNRDITAHKQSEEQNLRLAAIVESSDDAIIGKTLDGTITSWNKGAERIYGYKKNEVVGKSITILAQHYSEDEIQGLLEQIKSGKSVKRFETVRRKKDGNNIPVSLTISPIIDKEGNIIGASTIARDIFDRVKAAQERQALQEQLFQAQKMEAVGTLAGGIAHDFNNLLQVVLGYSEVMLLRKKEGESDYADLQNIYEAGKRGVDLVKSLLTFSRKVESQYVPMDLNQEIASVRDLLLNTIPKTITIDLHLSENLATIQADRSQISQILMNLGVNARDAMPDGGTLTIETANIQLDEEYCGIPPEVKPGNYVLLTVSDTGQGMDKETLSHLFEPFFTTKEQGKGTGLGLATVYGIVKNHSGHITCYSEPGHGTTFNIYLPSVQTKNDSETLQTEATIPVGTETILLVEDEDSVRKLSAMFLNGYGYKVIAVSNGKEAIEIYQREKDRISLILLDLIMPVMDGWQCLAKILRIDPNAKVIIASGYLEGGLTKDMQAKGAMGFVQKPFETSQLLTTIRDTLDVD